MPRHFRTFFQNREQAGKLLSRKLTEYKMSEAVVAGIPPGGLVVASTVAEELRLHLSVLSCRKIHHPSVSDKYIGSVSVNDIYVDEAGHDLPQDYIYHQLIMLRGAIGFERRFYDDAQSLTAVEKKDVILIDDYIPVGSCVKACVQTLRNAGASSITLAVPLITASAIRELAPDLDGVIAIYEESVLPPLNVCYKDNEYPHEAEIIRILKRHKTATA